MSNKTDTKHYSQQTFANIRFLLFFSHFFLLWISVTWFFLQLGKKQNKGGLLRVVMGGTGPSCWRNKHPESHQVLI